MHSTATWHDRKSPKVDGELQHVNEEGVEFSIIFFKETVGAHP